MSRYLVLPANASHDVHPDNSNSNYKIKLPERLRMRTGDWEVALCAITYPNNWYNVKDAHITLMHTVQKSVTTVKVPDGKYKTINALVSKCNVALAAANMAQRFKLIYREADGKVVLLGNSAQFFGVQFSADLADIMGFNPDRIYGDVGTLEAANTVNLEGGYDNIYVYSNLCANRVVGDSLVPCLHVIATKQPDDGTFIVHDEITNPVYVPIAHLDTDTVEVDIRRGDGKSVAFRGGCVVMTVHIRPANQSKENSSTLN